MKEKIDLKTLKDIYGKKRDDRRKSRISLVEDYKQDLRAEAVKWVKACPLCVNIKCDTCQKFIDFFNLSREDLK